MRKNILEFLLISFLIIQLMFPQNLIYINGQYTNETVVDYRFNKIIGSDGYDYGRSIVVDKEQNIIFAGYVSYPIFYTNFSGPQSFYDGPFYDRDREKFTEYPIVNAYDNSYNGNTDAVITKIDKDGNIIWSTYLGGTRFDRIENLAIDSDNNIIAVGWTSSNNYPNFNTNNNITYRGNSDGIVTKIYSNGSIIWSTLIGGSDNDIINSVEIDSKNNIFIIGRTSSNDFPTKDAFIDEYQGYPRGGNAFITKLDSDGLINWSTFVGGTVYDYGYDITIDKQDNIYGIGWTKSPDFPLINTRSQYKGKIDIFVISIDNNGIVNWTFLLGGSLIDIGKAIKINNENTLYITGYTYSSDFPIVNGTISDLNSNKKNNPIADAFIMKIDVNSTIYWSTFIGGSKTDIASDLVIDDDNNILITGTTRSIDFPLYGNYSKAPKFNLGSPNGDIAEFDAFLTKLSEKGNFMWSIYFGGEGYDSAASLSIDNENNIYLIGYTNSINFATIALSNEFILTNMYLTSLTVPLGTFGKLTPRIEENNDNFFDQTLTKIFILLISSSLTIYLIYQYRVRKREKEISLKENIKYSEIHKKIDELLKSD